MSLSSNGFDKRLALSRKGELRVIEYLSKLNIAFKDIAEQHTPFDIMTENALIDVKTRRYISPYYDVYASQLPSWLEVKTDLKKIIAFVCLNSISINTIEVYKLPSMRHSSNNYHIYVPVNYTTKLVDLL